MALSNFNFSNNYNNNLFNLNQLPRHLQEEVAIVSYLGGGYYDNKFDEIVPNNSSLVSEVFKCVKDYLTKTIGSIYPKWNKNDWLNTASDAKSLHHDAYVAAPRFINGCKKIGKESNVEINFGPNNAFALKAEGSLRRKIGKDCKEEKISIEQATKKIGDALRGTIIVDYPEQMQEIVTKVNKWIQEENGDIIWKNIFEEDRESGYVGIHAKIRFPFNLRGNNRQILAELQLHFRSINDGSFDAPKERTHTLYKNNFTPTDSFITKAISKLSFLSGMANIGNICRTPASLMFMCKTHLT